MSQFCCVTHLGFFLFSITFFSVCQSFPNHSFNRHSHLKRISNRQEPLRSFEYELPTFLKRIHDLDNNQKNKDFLHSKMEKYTSESDSEFKPHTSCGKMTCDDVKDYPAELIQYVFSKTFKNKPVLLPREVSGTERIIGTVSQLADSKKYSDGEVYNNPIWIAPINSDFPSVEYESSSSDTKNALISGRMIDILLGKSRDKPSLLHSSHSHHRPSYVLTTKRPNCAEQIKLTSPKEALNERHNPVLLVNLPSYKLQAPECTAEQYCRDDRTPENHIWRCESKIIKVNLPTFDSTSKEVVTQSVLMTNGCDCKLVRSDFE